MSTQELGMDATPRQPERPSEPEQIVEFEYQFPRLDEVELPKMNLEPLRETAERALLIGIGATVLVARGIGSLVTSAARAGQEAAEHPGPVTRALLRLVRRPGEGAPAAEGAARVRVPVVPITDYDNLTAAEIITRLADLTPDQLRTVRDYEARNQARESVLMAVDQHLSA